MRGIRIQNLLMLLFIFLSNLSLVITQWTWPLLMLGGELGELFEPAERADRSPYQRRAFNKMWRGLQNRSWNNRGGGQWNSISRDWGSFGRNNPERRFRNEKKKAPYTGAMPHNKDTKNNNNNVINNKVNVKEQNVNQHVSSQVNNKVLRDKNDINSVNTKVVPKGEEASRLPPKEQPKYMAKRKFTKTVTVNEKNVNAAGQSSNQIYKSLGSRRKTIADFMKIDQISNSLNRFGLYNKLISSQDTSSNKLSAGGINNGVGKQDSVSRTKKMNENSIQDASTKQSAQWNKQNIIANKDTVHKPVLQSNANSLPFKQTRKTVFADNIQIKGLNPTASKRPDHSISSNNVRTRGPVALKLQSSNNNYLDKSNNVVATNTLSSPKESFQQNKKGFVQNKDLSNGQVITPKQKTIQNVNNNFHTNNIGSRNFKDVQNHIKLGEVFSKFKKQEIIYNNHNIRPVVNNMDPVRHPLQQPIQTTNKPRTTTPAPTTTTTITTTTTTTQAPEQEIELETPNGNSQPQVSGSQTAQNQGDTNSDVGGTVQGDTNSDVQKTGSGRGGVFDIYTFLNDIFGWYRWPGNVYPVGNWIGSDWRGAPTTGSAVGNNWVDPANDWKAAVREEARELATEKEGVWKTPNITKDGPVDQMCPIYNITYQDNTVIIDTKRDTCKLIITWHERVQYDQSTANARSIWGEEVYSGRQRIVYEPVVTYVNE